MRAEELVEAERERVRQASRALVPLIEEVRRALSQALVPALAQASRGLAEAAQAARDRWVLVPPADGEEKPGPSAG